MKPADALLLRFAIPFFCVGLIILICGFYLPETALQGWDTVVEGGITNRTGAILVGMIFASSALFLMFVWAVTAKERSGG